MCKPLHQKHMVNRRTLTTTVIRRSGVRKAKGEGKRLLKSQGSCKLGEYCTSHIKVKVSSIGVVVEYCQAHHNHDVQIRHLRVPGSVRASVAAKLEGGVPIMKILDEIRIQCHRLVGSTLLLGRM